MLKCPVRLLIELWVIVRTARDFFKDFDVLAPEISKKILAGGAWRGGGWGVVWRQGKCWNKCCMWRARANVGTIYPTISPDRCAVFITYTVDCFAGYARIM